MTKRITRLTESELVNLVRRTARKILREGISYSDAEKCKEEFLDMIENDELDPKQTLMDLVAGYIGGDVIDNYLRNNIMGHYADEEDDYKFAMMESSSSRRREQQKQADLEWASAHGHNLYSLGWNADEIHSHVERLKSKERSTSKESEEDIRRSHEEYRRKLSDPRYHPGTW